MEPRRSLSASAFALAATFLFSIPSGLAGTREDDDVHALRVQRPEVSQPAPLAPTATKAKAPVQLLVKFRAGASATARAEALVRAGARRTGAIEQLGIELVSVGGAAAETALQRLRGNPAVAYADPDARAVAFDTTPNDPWWPNQWSQVKTGTNKAWDTTTGAPSAVIAVLDTGVAFSQPDLQGAFVAGYDTVFEDNDPSDDDGHGTLATGVAAARGNNGTGVAGYCWRCAIMPVKALGTGGSGTLSDVTEAIVWATDHGARIISMSWGYKGSGPSSLASAIKYAADRNILLVAAAGNYGDTTPVYPAAYPEVVGVAGSDPTDALYSWSSRGSWVSVAAPGCNYSTSRSGSYGTFCGTSSATPAVAGIAGVLASAVPVASAADLRKALETTAVPIGSAVKYGRVDAARALIALVGTASPTTATAPANLTAPTLTGAAAVGSALAASQGTWSGTTPMTFSYQWLRCDTGGTGCAQISGATAASYAVASTDVGSTLRVAATATNSAGSATSTSAASSVVPAPPAQTSTWTFSGSLNKKQASRSFRVGLSAGTVTTSLAFSKIASLLLTITDGAGGVVGTASGPSVVTLVKALPTGTYDFTVTGGGSGNVSFTLTVVSAS